MTISNSACADLHDVLSEVQFEIATALAPVYDMEVRLLAKDGETYTAYGGVLVTLSAEDVYVRFAGSAGRDLSDFWESFYAFERFNETLSNVIQQSKDTKRKADVQLSAERQLKTEAREAVIDLIALGAPRREGNCSDCGSSWVEKHRANCRWAAIRELSKSWA